MLLGMALGCGSRTELRDAEEQTGLLLECPTTPNDPRLPSGYVGEELVIDSRDFATSEIDE